MLRWLGYLQAKSWKIAAVAMLAMVQAMVLSPICSMAVVAAMVIPLREDVHLVLLADVEVLLPMVLLVVVAVRSRRYHYSRGTTIVGMPLHKGVSIPEFIGLMRIGKGKSQEVVLISLQIRQDI